MLASSPREIACTRSRRTSGLPAYTGIPSRTGTVMSISSIVPPVELV